MADPEVGKVISPGALAGPALCTEFAGPAVLNPIRARTLHLIVISKKNAIPPSIRRSRSSAIPCATSRSHCATVRPDLGPRVRLPAPHRQSSRLPEPYERRRVGARAAPSNYMGAPVAWPYDERTSTVRRHFSRKPARRPSSSTSSTRQALAARRMSRISQPAKKADLSCPRAVAEPLPGQTIVWN